MNRNIVIPVLVALVMPALYFFYLEGFDSSVFKKAPQEFVSQTQDVFGLNEEHIKTEAEEALDFLDSLPEATTTTEVEVVVEELPDNSITYRVIFDATWSDGTHTGYFPDGAHLSPFVSWTHRDGNRIFALGEKSSAGMEKMAELGGTITLEQEIKKLQGQGIYDYSVGKKVDAPGITEKTITVDPAHTYITFVSMIAPSPDWYISVENISLLKDGIFVDELSLPLIAYDAGTEEGTGFSIKNSPTDPQGVIAPLTDIPADVLGPFGTVTFKKI